MTVVGDDIIKSCSYCWSNYSYGVRLNEDAKGNLECPNCKSKYRIENGMLKRI